MDSIRSENNKVLDTDVAIIGIGLRVPDSSTPNEFWENLISKKDSIRKITPERMNPDYFKFIEHSQNGGFLDFKEWKNFDNEFFGITKEESKYLDPQQRLLLKCAYETFEDSKLLNSHRGSNTSVFIGSHLLEYQEMNSNDNSLLSYHPFLANHLSYAFDLRGQSAVVNTACSSSFDCINFGYQSIMNGSSEMSLCGGVNTFFTSSFLTKLSTGGALSKTGRSHTFEAEADGYCRGEGAALILLKKYSKAIEDGNNIYCVIRTCNTNNDGAIGRATRTMPSSIGQCDNIKKALSNINMHPSEIFYIEPHGTGTPIGDPIETQGIANAFKESHQDTPLYMGSLKPNIGHLESASGATSLIKVALMLKNRKLCPMMSFKNPNPNIDFEGWRIKVVTEEIEFPKDKRINIGVNNFGIGSTNTFIIVSECINSNNQINQITNSTTESISNSKDDNVQYLIPFSANSSKSIDLYKNKIVESIEKYSESIDFQTFLSEQFKQPSFYQRSVINAGNWEDLKQMNQISSSKSKQYSTFLTKSRPSIVFVFCGQGPQYKSMGIKLYNQNPIFRKSINICDDNLKKYFGYSIFQKINNLQDNEKSIINEPMLAQPSIFLIQYGLYELYKHWGIEANAVIGHSFGEVTSAYASGMISLDTSCKIIYHRALLQNKTIGLGRMLSIGIGNNDFEKRYSNKQWFKDVEVACYNSPDSIVITSNESTLNEIKNDLKSQDIFATLLTSPCPFHSSKQEMIKDETLSIDIPDSSPPSIPFYSTVTSNQWDKSKKYDSQYLYDNIRMPVLFEQTLNNLFKNQEIIQNKNIIFIEVSPHPTLSYYIKNSKIQITTINPLNRNKDDIETFNTSIGSIYCSGGNINFSCQLNQLSIDPIRYNFLPRYCWDEKEYWIEDKEISNFRKNGLPTDTLGFKIESVGNTIYQTTIDLSRNAFSYLIDHKVGNDIYYPGCGYIYSIHQYYRNKNIFIYYFIFSVPLILTETSKCDIQMIVTKLSKNEDKVQFMKKEHGKDDIFREVGYAKVSIMPLDTNKYINTNDFIDKCNIITLNQDQLYYHTKHNVGLNYGPKFQRVKEIKVGNIYSYYKISIKERDSPFDYEFLSPSILDASLHNGIFQIDSKNSNLVLDRIEDFIIYSDNIPKKESRDQIEYLHIMSKYLGTEGRSIKYEIHCYLEDGLLLYKSTVTLTNLKNNIEERTKITNPTSKIYSSDWQLKESQLQSPNTFTKDNDIKSIILYEDTEDLKKWTSKYMFQQIKKTINEITPELILQLSIDELLDKYLIKNSTIHEKRLFIKIFKLLKQYNQILNDPIDDDAIQIKNEPNTDIKVDIIYLLKSSISYQIFQCIQSEYKETFDKFEILNFSEVFYNKGLISLNKSICKTVNEMIGAIVYTKSTFKIIEFGGGSGGLTIDLIKSINDLLINNPNYLIDIEYTFSDISPTFLEKAKESLKPFKNIKVIYKTLDLDKDLLKQSLNPTTYDLVVMHSVVHCAKDLNYTFDQIINIMNPSGQMIMVEPSKIDFFTDIIFSNFPQWNHFEDNVRTDHCCLNIDEWYQFLTNKGFTNEISCSKTKDDQSCFYIHAQKHKLFSNTPSIQYLENQNKIYDNVIIYSSENKESMNILENHYTKVSKNPIYTLQSSSSIIELSESQDFKNSNSNLFVFGKGLDSLNQNNFEHYCMELTSLLQFILKNNYNNYKLVLFTMNSEIESINYLNSSLIGVIKYLFIHPEVKCYTIDFDNESFRCFNTLENIEKLFNDNIIERYFVIRNNQLYIEKVHMEKNHRLSTNSFEKENIIARLNQSLECDFVTIPSKLNDDDVLVQVMATGVNFKDMLFHLGQVSETTMGLEYSGIVVKTGKNVTKLKVGDQVYGASKHSMSSHVVTNIDYCLLKPSNISFEEAAAIPIIYSTSYYCLFVANNYENNQTILIHSATGGVGLSCLNLLKWKQFKGLLFVTVGSKEKEDYLREKYGDFITGIYSTRDIEYSFKIKKYLQDNGHNKCGVDVILNTLSGEFMSANYYILNNGGKIVDLSITHIIKNELQDYKTMDTHRSYINVEMSSEDHLVAKYLRKITPYFENNEIELIPIKTYPIEDIDKLFTEMRNRKNIGKLVLNYSDRSFFNNYIKNNYYNYNILKDDYQISSDHLGETVLITGQRGVALHTTKWILSYNQNVKDIIILSRSEINWELEYAINKYKLNGGKIRIHYKNVEVSNYNNLKTAVKEIYSDYENVIKPVNSIFHYAFQLSDAQTKNTTLKNIKEAHSGKSHGAINLHNLSIEMNWNLKTFLLNSSIITMFGSEFQLSYFSANTLVESLNRHRRSLGLSSICIRWGGLDSSYITRKFDEVSNIDFNYLITINEILGGIDILTQNQDRYNEFSICTFDPNFCKSQIYQNHFDNAFDFQKGFKTLQSGSSIKDSIVSKLSSLLQIDSEKINLDMTLSNYGADSLLMIQFKTWLEKEYIQITLEKLQNSTINNIIDFITESN